MPLTPQPRILTILMTETTIPKAFHLIRFMEIQKEMTSFARLRPITPMRETIMCSCRLRTAFRARISVSS